MLHLSQRPKVIHIINKIFWLYVAVSTVNNFYRISTLRRLSQMLILPVWLSTHCKTRLPYMPYNHWLDSSKAKPKRFLRLTKNNSIISMHFSLIYIVFRNFYQSPTNPYCRHFHGSQHPTLFWNWNYIHRQGWLNNDSRKKWVSK